MRLRDQGSARSFAPTKLNVADGPTREAELRESSPLSVLDFLSPSDLRQLHWEKTARPSANWIRLVILACATQPVDASGWGTCGFGFGSLSHQNFLGFGFGRHLPSWTFLHCISLLRDLWN